MASRALSTFGGRRLHRTNLYFLDTAPQCDQSMRGREEVSFTYQAEGGQTWYLHAKDVPVGDGQTLRIHYFARELTPEEAVESLPEGYTVFDAGRLVKIVTVEQAERYRSRLAEERRGKRSWSHRRGNIDWAALALELG